MRSNERSNEKKRSWRRVLWMAGLLVLLAAIYVGYRVAVNSDVGRVTGTVRAVEKDVTAVVGSVTEASADAATTAKVKTALALSKRVSAFDIDVDSHRGKVVLKGRVPSQEVGQAAVAIAGDTTGVDVVESRLVVDPAVKSGSRDELAERAADLEIKAAIYEGLLREKDLGGRGITVRVERRIVTLTGLVPTADDGVRAERACGSVPGIRKLVNELKVVSAAGKQ